jgi:hypothetical protein
MARAGPVTKDTSTVALGLAQIRVKDSASYIGDIHPQLVAADSIGALASTTFTGNVDYWRLESGFPLLEDLVIPLRETAMLECAVKEITPFNLALAKGIDPSGGGYTAAHSGEVGLGQMSTPDYMRMEAIYTYPNGTNYLNIIFPRAQVVSSIELDFQAEDNVNSPMSFEAKRADSEVSGGSAGWDDKPLGWITWT